MVPPRFALLTMETTDRVGGSEKSTLYADIGKINFLQSFCYNVEFFYFLKRNIFLIRKSILLLREMWI